MLDTLLASLATGLIGLFVGHRLGVGKDSSNRRREFRDSIRNTAGRIDAAHFISLHKTYQESVPVVREASGKIVDDISFWRRRSFIACCKTYCAFKQSDIVPPPPSAAATPEEMTARKRKHEGAKAMLADALEGLIRHAK